MEIDYEVVFDGRTLNGRPLSGFMGQSSLADMIEAENVAPSVVARQQRRNIARRAKRLGLVIAPDSRTCRCGCGGALQIAQGRGGVLQYLPGHYQAHVNLLRRLAHAARPRRRRFCACGCGGQIPFEATKGAGRPKLYLDGHSTHYLSLRQRRQLPRCETCYKPLVACNGHVE
jgi:hypothetical protein